MREMEKATPYCAGYPIFGDSNHISHKIKHRTATVTSLDWRGYAENSYQDKAPLAFQRGH